jgi:hypothetical protein
VEVGAGAGVAGDWAGAAGLAGGLGMYSGPVWPQPASSTAAVKSAMGDFTIRITV